MMGPSWIYWIVAWTMMGLACSTAAGAIIFGSMRLDRASCDRDPEQCDRH